MVKAVRVLVGAELLAAAVAGHAYSPGSGLSGTPHDWSTGDGTTVLLWKDRQGGATTYNTGTPWIDPATGRQGTTRIANGQCATCHTPQQAGSSTLLWNYTLQPVGYRWNDPATTAGTRYPVFQGDTYNDVGSGNIVAGVVPGRTGNECSSCHDAHNGSQVRTRWRTGSRRWRLPLQSVPPQIVATASTPKAPGRRRRLDKTLCTTTQCGIA